MAVEATQILADHEGSAVETLRADAPGRVVILCEHAARTLPLALGDLGLDAAALESHIAWDPGARPVAVRLAELLDSPAVLGRFSRLAYDCNRPPDSPTAIVEISETYKVPGNMGLKSAERDARVAAFYMPFHRAADAVLAPRGPRAVLVTIHSFTPVFMGQTRAVELGFLHDEDSRLADAMLRLAPNHTALNCQINQPYSPTDGVAHSLQKHGIKRGIPNVMIEIRNDLIATPDAQAGMAVMLADLFNAALAEVAP